MNLTEYLAIPYIVAVESVPGQDGNFMCRVEHPELPDCSAEATSIFDALDRLDQRKQSYIQTCLQRGDHVPVPRSPLRDLLAQPGSASSRDNRPAFKVASSNRESELPSPNFERVSGIQRWLWGR